MTVLSVVAYSSKERQIRNRWLVAYTLIRNPSLQCTTAANLPNPSGTTAPPGREELVFASHSPSPELSEVAAVPEPIPIVSPDSPSSSSSEQYNHSNVPSRREQRLLLAKYRGTSDGKKMEDALA